MRLLSLVIRDFRNLEAVDLETDSRFVVFAGENAQGKTNCLEAIYGLATLKSFRARRNRELIRFGADEAHVGGQVEDEGLRRRFRFSVGPSGRTGEVDGQRPSQLRDYFEGIRAVLFCPEDTAMVRGDPSGRRRFLDRAAFTARPSFLDIARDYRRVLHQRGAVLRSPAPDLAQLDVFDHQLARFGAELSVRRQEIVAELSPHFVALHAEIASGSAAKIRYRASLGRGDRAEQQTAFMEQLAASRQDELRRGMNLVGPHRDDLQIEVEGKQARAYGSQGQVRSVVIALKLAELQAARTRGSRLIFLLDDLSSELDQRRTEQLLGLLKELELQTFVTTTDVDRLAGLPGDDARFFKVVGGQVLAAGDG